MSVYTSSRSQLLHEEHSKHIMEVALKNMKTDLKHDNKTLTELQKRKGELYNELRKSISLKKYEDTHNLLQECFF